MATCPIPDLMLKDPRFQALVEAYASKHLSADYLAEALELYRKKLLAKRGPNGVSSDFYPQTPAERGQFTRFMNYELPLMKATKTSSVLSDDAVYNLYSQMYSMYSPDILEWRLELLARKFRDRVTYLNQLSPNKTRQEVIASQGSSAGNGYVAIMNQVFRDLEKNADVDALVEKFQKKHPSATEAELATVRQNAAKRAAEYRKMLDNKSALSVLASVRIGETEGFSVSIRNSEINFEEYEDALSLLEQMEAEGRSTEQIDLEEATKGDRYIDYRTVKLMETLMPRLKLFLSDVEKVNDVGDQKRDDIGNPLYLNARQSAIVLQRILTNSTPDTFMGDILSGATQYPWLKGLHDKLEKNPEFRKSVYTGLKTQEANYLYITVEDGRYKLVVANSKARTRALEAEAANNLQDGTTLNRDYSIVTGYGQLRPHDELMQIKEVFDSVYSKVVTLASAINAVGGVSYTPGAITDEINRLQKQGVDVSFLREKDPAMAMQKLFDNNPKLADDVANLLRGLGFNVVGQNIIDMAKQPLDEKNLKYLGGNPDSREGKNKLCLLAKNMKELYNGLDYYNVQQKTEFTENTGRFFYNKYNDSFRRITGCLALALYDERQDRTLNDGKVLNTHTPVNLIHQVIDKLANKDGRTEEKYLDDLKNDFIQYEGMALTTRKGDKSTGWLKYLIENPELRRLLQVQDNIGNNHVEYSALSRAQKIVSSMISYFASPDTLNGNIRLIEVPIQSDYGTAYNFIAAPHYQVNEVIENLVDEVLIEVQRISAIRRRADEKILDADGREIDNPNYDPNRAKLGLYEEQGREFQIFPAMNESRLYERILQQKADDPSKIRDLVRSEVEAQMDAVVTADLKTLKDSGVLTNELLRSVGRSERVSLYEETGDPMKLSDESRGALRDFFFNVFYARQQMAKLLTGGLEQFNGLIDYEKRNMMLHAPHSSLDTNAYWGKEKVGRTHQTCLYMNDDKSASVFKQQIQQLLEAAKDEGLITENQYKTMSSAYDNITSTDGQGFRTLESYREIMIMSDQWSQRHENAYGRLIKGEPTTEDINLFIAEIKPVYTGYEHIDAASGENQKPVRLSVLHKYSETVLLPLALGKYCLKARTAPYMALEDARQRLEDRGQRVDLFLFKSCVKVGYHSGLRPFDKWRDIKGDKSKGESDEEARRKLGWDGQSLDERIQKDWKAISDYIVEQVDSSKFTLHTIPLSGYGIAAPMPVKVEDEYNHIVSQAEKQLWSNLLKNDEVTFRGKKIKATEARDKYYKIKTAEIISQYKKLQKLFRDRDELEKLMREELLTKSYNSGELKFALSHLKDGSFALPLFSPNIEHQIQQLFSSVIKKRISKPKQKGSNLIQVTGFGIDKEISTFDNDKAISEKELLGIEFGGKEKTVDNIKWVDVAMPIHDKRLKKYADENGGIDADRLQQLVNEGKIDERILYFMAYRTPSDGEHSVIPCRIKYFITDIGGAGIRMPREIMVMTGHDYDGDKMHCHFAEFTEGWDEEKIRNRYNEYLRSPKDRMMRFILGLSNTDVDAENATPLTWEEYLKRFKSSRNIPKQEYRKIKYIQYDDEAGALSNSEKAMANGKLELMFAKATSPRGSRMMVIPGGCEDTKIIAKSMQITRLARKDEITREDGTKVDGKTRDTVVNSLVAQGASQAEARALMRNTRKLFTYLLKKTDSELMQILRAINGNETPFSFTHSIDAFDYIMGGANMIEVYALFSSSFQMFQRLDLKYRPYTTKTTKKQVPVKIMGHTISSFSSVRTMDSTDEKGGTKKGRLRSLTSSHLVNAAVDNGKDPLLGYLNQGKAVSDLTVFLDAAGFTELEIHTMINQPVLVELARRLTARGSKGFVTEAEGIIDELVSHNAALSRFSDHKIKGQIAGISYLADKKIGSYMDNLAIDYADLQNLKDLDTLKLQVALLQTIVHLHPVVEDLSSFVRKTRPESDSGSNGTSLFQLLARLMEMRKFRNKLDAMPEYQQAITGMKEVLAAYDIHEGWDPEYIMDLLTRESKLPEVTAMNNLMLEESVDLFALYFPQARESWNDVAGRIAKEYSYRQIQEGTLKKIFREMILWKLLENKAFIQGDVKAEQKRVIVDVPYYLKKLKERMYSKSETEDPAKSLRNNIFLKQFSVDKIRDDSDIPRVSFYGNSMEGEGIGDAMRSYWNQLLQSNIELQKPGDPKYTVADLAVDLFLYGLHTNGFNYGRYEFAHFVPFSVILKTPGYVEALQSMVTDDWMDEDIIENFINQYYMNHWGDGKLVQQVNADSKDLIFVESNDGNIRLSDKTSAQITDAINKKRYIVLYQYTDRKERGRKVKEEHLYRVLPVSEAEKGDGVAVILEETTKLGVRNFHSQVTLQYNPGDNYRDIKPVVAGNDSAWGSQEELNFHAESNFGDTVGMEAHEAQRQALAKIDITALAQRSVFRGGYEQREAKKKEIEQVEEKAIPANAQNEQILNNAPQTPEDVGTEEPVELQPDTSAGISLEEIRQRYQGMDMSTYVSQRMFGNKRPHLVTADEKGNVTTKAVDASPYNISQARKQRTFVELNKRLRDILRRAGISVGTLTSAEARLGMSGVSDFDTALVTAEGLKEMIRISNDELGEQALPEEFAHISIEMLGYDHPLVQRLLAVLRSNRQAMQEAYDGMYDQYEEYYGDTNQEDLIVEAAGKLVAKALFRQQEIETRPIRSLITRIVDAIKRLFRGVKYNDVQNAILDAQHISSQLARELLGGQLLDSMDAADIRRSGKLYSVANDISEKQDVVSKLLKQLLKRRAILRTRLAYAKNKGQNQALAETDALISQIESEIGNVKAEEVVISYFQNSLSFIKQAKESLDAVIGRKGEGRQKANSVTKKVGTFTDILQGVAQDLDTIKQAITAGEIQDTEDLNKLRHEMELLVSDYYTECDNIRWKYAVEMMSDVYGAEGFTKKIGKEKGRKISIEEMLSRADGDISLVTRWFGSLSDANDFVLQAVDDYVKGAKRNARRRMDSVRPRVLAAIAKLERETGSRDQSFMKEYKRYDGKAWCNYQQDDGELHYTGRKIVKGSKEYRALSDAQRAYYDEITSILDELYKFVPEQLLEDDFLPMVRKRELEAMKGAKGWNGKWETFWDNYKKRWIDTSDDIHYEDDPVAMDFSGNRVEKLPLKFLHKGKNEQYDDMTDDIATATIAFANMALEYHEMNKIIGIIENVKYVAANRDVVQKTGWRTKKEFIGNPDKDETIYSQEFTVKQASTLLQQMLNDYFQMHVYEHLQADEGTIGKTNISKRKAAERLVGTTSISQMAFNLTQRITNLTTGNTQIIIDAIGGDKFTAADLAWAVGEYLKNAPDRLMDTGKDESDNYLSLFLERFDIHQNNRKDGVQLARGRLTRMVNTNLMYAGLRLGEDALAAVTAMAIAHAHKVSHKVDGEVVEDNLFNAYEKKYADPENKVGAYLVLKEGYTEVDTSAINRDIEDAYEKLTVRTNFDNQGIYNTDDKNAAEQYILGSFTMMYRKWIYPALKRRYAKAHVDVMAGGEAEGFHRTMGRFLLDTMRDAKDQVTEEQSVLALLNLYQDIKALASAVRINWDKLDPYEQANIRKSLTELGTFVGLWLGIALLSNIHDRDDDDELSWWDNQLMVQMLRLRTEIGSQAPTPMLVNEAGKIIRSPFAALSTVQDTLNGLRLLIPSNYWTEIKSGRYKGHTKAYKYFRELPVISVLKKFDNFADPSPLIQYYKSDAAF